MLVNTTRWNRIAISELNILAIIKNTKSGIVEYFELTWYLP